MVHLAGTLIPVGLIVVTLHTYWSHCDDDDDDDKFSLVMLSLERVMLVSEVVNTVTTLVLVLVTVTV